MGIEAQHPHHQFSHISLATENVVVDYQCEPQKLSPFMFFIATDIRYVEVTCPLVHASAEVGVNGVWKHFSVVCDG